MTPRVGAPHRRRYRSSLPQGAGDRRALAPSSSQSSWSSLWSLAVSGLTHASQLCSHANPPTLAPMTLAPTTLAPVGARRRRCFARALWTVHAVVVSATQEAAPFWLRQNLHTQPEWPPGLRSLVRKLHGRSEVHRQAPLLTPRAPPRPSKRPC
jgi:hypothetical protein